MGIFFTLFYQPVFNLLIFLYTLIPFHDLGVSTILLTLIIRLLLYPLSRKAIKSQKDLQTIQPEIEKIKEKHKDDKEKMGPELMALYKEKNINPFSSCLPVLIQLPFLIAIYRVFFNILSKGEGMGALYAVVPDPGIINTTAFGFIDFVEKSIWLALLAGAAQFWQSKMMMSKKQGTTNPMASQMMYMMPVITVVIGASFPAGLIFYWFVNTLFSVGQQYLVLGKKPKKEESK